MLQVATFLPFFDMMIIDRAMKGSVAALGYDKKYNTKVFALKDYEDIKSALGKL